MSYLLLRTCWHFSSFLLSIFLYFFFQAPLTGFQAELAARLGKGAKKDDDDEEEEGADEDMPTPKKDKKKKKKKEKETKAKRKRSASKSSRASKTH